MRFKTIYDTYEEKQGIIFKEPTMTIQSEKDNCDINVIMNRYATCGTPLPYRTDGVQPVYADVSELGDYMENFQRCKQAEEMFNSLPSALRKELDNNPACESNITVTIFLFLLSVLSPYVCHMVDMLISSLFVKPMTTMCK